MHPSLMCNEEYAPKKKLENKRSSPRRRGGNCFTVRLTKIVYAKHNCILPVSTGVSGNLKDKSASASKASKSASSTTQKKQEK
jgi:hypothetical protein